MSKFKDINLTKLNFDNTKIPDFKETNTKTYVKNGDNNDYPYFLNTLFERSTLHSNIIKNKVLYINGKSLIVKKDYTNPLIKNANETEDLYTVIKKCVSDVEKYNSFFLKINLNAKNEISKIQHLVYSNCRVNKAVDKVFYSEEWLTEYFTENTKVKPIPFDIYEKGTKNKETIYFFNGDNSDKAYALPKYISGVASILTDIQIQNFHKKAIDNGFKGGTMIVFKNGIPSADEMSVTERKLKAKFTSTDDSNSVLVDFVDDKDSVPEILQLNANNFDKQYETLALSVDKKIAQAHQIPSLMLFAERVEGQLGGRNELIDIYQLIQNSYVNPAQQVLEDIFNYLLNEEEAIKIEKLPFLQREFSEQTLLAVLTKNEIREMLGKEPIDENVVADTLTVESQSQQYQEVFKYSKEEDAINTLLTLNPKLTIDELVTFTKLSKNSVQNILKTINK